MLEENVNLIAAVLLIGTIVVVILLGIIAYYLSKIANRQDTVRMRTQRVIWKSATFDFKNVGACIVVKSDEDEPSANTLEGFECVAVIHTDRVDDEDRQIVETIYAKTRPEE